MKINRKTVLSTAAVLGVAALVAGGTIAYFTDHESVTNNFTVGNVDIELYESQFHRTNGTRVSTEPMQGVAGTASDDHVGTKTWNGTASGWGGDWASAYYTDEQIIADAANYGDYIRENGTAMVPGSNVQKNAYVKNVGTSDAYIRTKYMIPSSLFAILDQSSSWVSSAMARGNDNNAPIKSEAIAMYYAYLVDGDTSAYYTGDYTGNYADYINAMRNAGKTVNRTGSNEKCTAGEDGCVEYLVMDFTYQDALESGKMTFWSPYGNFKLANTVTSEDLANVDSFKIFVEADGIQADGFNSATAAFQAYDTQNNG